MKKFFVLCVSFLLACVASASPRKSSLDQGWRFHYGDTPAASSPDFDDSGWRLLNLPHDWSVETEAAAIADTSHVGPFVKGAQAGPSSGFTVGGVGWYRRTFTLGAEDLEGRVMLYFEGAYNQTEVWLNGERVYFNHYGYQSFRFDITRYCREAGKQNVLAVRVSNEGLNTRWYAGSGIYRHVWLMRVPCLHLDAWETFYSTTKLTDEQATVALKTTVKNEGTQGGKHKLRAVIYDAENCVVAQGKADVRLAAKDSQVVEMSFRIENPRLWWPANMGSEGSPYLYRAVLRVGDDELTTRIGVRTLSFDAENGFLINGKPTLLYGGCLHHDNGLLGAAAYDAAENRKLSLLRAQGFNAVRTSHNMPSEHFLDACDSLGLMVVDENFDQWLRAKNPDDYHRYFLQHSERDFSDMVKRDRNHPSIIMWSIGNEIPGRIEPEGLAAAERLRQVARGLDTTRAVTAAIPEWDDFRHTWQENDDKAFRSLDVGGYNYMYYRYEHDHETHPQRVMVGLETYPKRAAENWLLAERHPFVIGDFVWTAMDYLGEAGIGSASIRTSGQQPFSPGWPWFNGWCGDIDLVGEKKPQSYYRDVVWGRSPVTMATQRPVLAGSYESISLWGWQLEEQSWTYDGYAETDTFRVNVYSRAPRVRLYLNGDLVGEKAPSETFWAGFSVCYRQGTLRAVNLDAEGNETGESFSLVTASRPVALRLKCDRSNLKSADVEDLAYVTVELVDEQGRVVPDSDRMVSFSVEGDGELLACGNACPNDMESFRNPSPRLFWGRAQAIVKSAGRIGAFTLRVSSPGLPDTSVSIPVE